MNKKKVYSLFTQILKNKIMTIITLYHMDHRHPITFTYNDNVLEDCDFKQFSYHFECLSLQCNDS